MSVTVVRSRKPEDDLATVAAIEAVPTILDVICRTTGMGFAAIARVTEDRWIACGVRDEIDFGLKPSGELAVETTICDEVRLTGAATVIDDVALDPVFCRHPTPALYGFRSYVSVPITLPDGTFFGTLCAIDPQPRRVDTPEIAGLFRMFAQLIAFHIDAQDKLATSAGVLIRNDALETEVARRTQERDETWRLSQDMLIVLRRDGTIQSVNPAWTRTLGYDPEDLVGHRISDFLDPDRSGSVLGDAGKHAGSNVFETRVRHKDGAWRELAWTAVPSGETVHGVARDVTEDRKRAASLLLYENIVQSSAAPICAFDTRYRLIAFNKAHSDEFYRIYQYSVKVGDVFYSLFAPDQAPVMQALMARALTGEVFSVEEEFGDPTITKPCWEIHYAPLRDAEGRIIGAFHLARDISDRLRAQSELEIAQEALRQSQKMEAVGQLTGGLAHDFNNLLTGISGSLDLLKTRVAQGRINDLDRYLAAAQGASKRAAALTHRLLAFSRRQTLDPKPTDVHKLVLGMADLIRRTVGPEIAVETVDMAGLWLALVDPPQLENALLNLCINARDAMPDGGRITIETANRWMDARMAHERDVRPGQYLALCVSDTGAGMTPDVIGRAFDPFFTTKPLGMGTGLGLSMIYGFARQSGGQVRIYSEVGRGTMVCIYLPRHYGEKHDAEPDAGAGREASRAVQGESVLVIDDEPTVRMLVTDVLEDLGYDALEAGDGPSGLAILQSRARVDLLITDVGLPGGMNGRQVADAARVLRPGLKVLFITGYAENAVVGNGHLDPGMAVMTKPFAMDDLAVKIRGLIEE